MKIFTPEDGEIQWQTFFVRNCNNFINVRVINKSLECEKTIKHSQAPAIPHICQHVSFRGLAINLFIHSIENLKNFQVALASTQVTASPRYYSESFSLFCECLNVDNGKWRMEKVWTFLSLKTFRIIECRQRKMTHENKFKEISTFFQLQKKWLSNAFNLIKHFFTLNRSTSLIFFQLLSCLFSIQSTFVDEWITRKKNELKFFAPKVISHS